MQKLKKKTPHTSHSKTDALFLKEVYKRLHWRELIPHQKKVCMKYNALVMCLLYATIQATGQNKQEEFPLITPHPKMACESCYNLCVINTAKKHKSLVMMQTLLQLILRVKIDVTGIEQTAE